MKKHSRLNNLEKAHLFHLCKKYSIDPAEIDSGISYTENKLHLNKIVKIVTHKVSTWEVKCMVEEREQWINEHFLDYFLALQMYGETTPTDVGQAPAPPRPFSLHEFIEITKRKDYGQLNSAHNEPAKAAARCV